MTDRPIIARRYLTAERAAPLAVRFPKDGPSAGYMVYDIARNAWAEFVIVPADDPRVDTIETFDTVPADQARTSFYEP